MDEINYILESYGNVIVHSGTPHDGMIPHSGRFKFGSGDDPNQRIWDFATRYEKLRKTDAFKDLSNGEIAKELGYTKDATSGEHKGEKIGDVAKINAMKHERAALEHTELKARALELSAMTDADGKQLYSRDKIATILRDEFPTAKVAGESTVRSLIDESAGVNRDKIDLATDILKSKGVNDYIDVGPGVAQMLEITDNGLLTSLEMLKDQGYHMEVVSFKRPTNPDQQVNIKVLCPPGTEEGDGFKNRFNIKSFEDNDPNADIKMDTSFTRPPAAIDLDRVSIKYDERGGTLKDGLIEIRATMDKDGNVIPACADLDMGNARYGQVRIAVNGEDGTPKYYIKGMAVYSDSIPTGKDVLVNSNKSMSEGVDEALKPIKSSDAVSDAFGAVTWQTTYKDPKTGKEKLSAINIISDEYGSKIHKEGSWDDYRRSLPSQFLSKQPLGLVKQQLSLKQEQVLNNLKEIEALPDGAVKRKMLLDFADSADGEAKDLRGAALPGQGVKVLLPSTDVKEHEIYAPTYENGTYVACIRFPHAGPFEIPVCKVNNNIKSAEMMIGKQGRDAVAMNYKDEIRLSGADNDGDIAIVIPITDKNGNRKVNMNVYNTLPRDIAIGEKMTKVSKDEGFAESKTTASSASNFSPAIWKIREGSHVKVMSERTKGLQMGEVSNLITDMYVKGCSDPDELVRADKYSMVVIDAKKHGYDYKAAYDYYNIGELKTKYQGKPTGGVSSLMSRAKSTVDVEKMSTRFKINPDTGEKEYFPLTKNTKKDRDRVRVLSKTGTYTDEFGDTHKTKWEKNADGTYIYQKTTDKAGHVKDLWVDTGTTSIKKEKQARMDTVTDARELLSSNPTQIELAYADYANHMKAMANQARKESLTVKRSTVDPDAKQEYAQEINTLKAKLNTAKKNAPRERRAIVLANSTISATAWENPDMSMADRKKEKAKALTQARRQTGANKAKVTFTDREWDAIIANAISDTMTLDLLNNSTSKEYVKRATPKSNSIGNAKIALIKSYLSAGYSYEEIADNLGVSSSTISNVQSGKLTT